MVFVLINNRKLQYNPWGQMFKNALHISYYRISGFRARSYNNVKIIVTHIKFQINLGLCINLRLKRKNLLSKVNHKRRDSLEKIF